MPKVSNTGYSFGTIRSRVKVLNTQNIQARSPAIKKYVAESASTPGASGRISRGVTHRSAQQVRSQIRSGAFRGGGTPGSTMILPFKPGGVNIIKPAF